MPATQKSGIKGRRHDIRKKKNLLGAGVGARGRGGRGTSY